MSKSLVQKQRIVAKKGFINGREATAFFAVVEGSEGYSVRLVDVRYAEKSEVILLPKAKAKSVPIISIKSPYFRDTESFVADFSFITSQPTRAPNFA